MKRIEVLKLSDDYLYAVVGMTQYTYCSRSDDIPALRITDIK